MATKRITSRCTPLPPVSLGVRWSTMMRTNWIVALLVFNLMGCYTQVKRVQSVAERQPVQPRGFEVHTKAPDPAVHVSLTLSNDEVSSAHPVEVTISITNMTDERILWGCGSSSCRLSFLVVDNDEVYKPYLRIMCTMDSRPYYLDPRATDTQKFIWSGRVHERGSNSNWYLPSGSYALIGVACAHRSSQVTIMVD
jgi:hypothetical protein